VKPGTGCRGIVFRTVRFGLPSKPVLALDTAIRAFTTALSSVSWAPANWHPSIPHCRAPLKRWTWPAHPVSRAWQAC